MARSQISQNLQVARENAGWDQAPAATKLGVHEQTLSKYERGVIKKVPMEVLMSAAVLYSVSVDQLTKGVIKKGERVSDNGSRDTSPRGIDAESRANRIRELEEQFGAAQAEINEMVRRGAPSRDVQRRRAELTALISDGLALGATDPLSRPGLADAIAELFLNGHGAPAPASDRASGKKSASS